MVANENCYLAFPFNAALQLQCIALAGWSEEMTGEGLRG